MNPLLIRRRGMMQAASAPLPDGQIEWIETDGVAYISVSSVNAKFLSSSKTKVLPPDSDYTSAICGIRTAANNFLAYAVFRIESGVRKFSFARRSLYIGADYTFGYTEPVEVEQNWVNSSNASVTLKRNGATLDTFSVNTAVNSVASSLPIHIFGLNHDGTNTYCGAGMRIYSIQLYNNPNYSTMVFNGIPWRLNGKVGLMDTLTDTFYGNAAGSGAFIGGPNVI